MPPRQSEGLLHSLRAHAATIIREVEGHVRRIEEGLEDLREQADTWRKLVGRKVVAAVGSGSGHRGNAQRVRSRGGKRVNWDDVLASVPQRFGIEHVMKHPGAAAKGRAQAYPALNRWEATKRIKRVEKGVYEKAGGASPTREPGMPARRGPAKKRPAATKK